MSIKKVALSFALAGILGATYAVAETDGAFVGVQAGYGGLNVKSEEKSADGTQSESNSETLNGFRYGFVAGYKQFFTPEFGLRYYAGVDLGTDYTKTINGVTAKISSYNINANVDALYNFVSSANLDLGAFVGVGLGYANHKHKFDNDTNEEEGGANDNPFESIAGFDLAINFGLRTNIAKNHGIELYSRFGVLPQKKEHKYEGDYTTTLKLQQPYQVGLRYTFSF